MGVLKILSVDDSWTVRQTLRNMVEVVGAELLEAENGKLGLELLQDHFREVDLIILDIEMPEMNGLEFLKAVKEDDRFKDIPIIMLTTVTMKEKMVDAIRSGAKSYITKPFTSEELLTKLVQVLGMDRLG